MRLGGPVLEAYDDPDSWVRAVKRRGYGAAYCPVKLVDELVQDYADAARAADIVIAEVGAWSNPLSMDTATRAAALDKCRAMLALADEIGALCCVNIAGSRSPEHWDGPHPDNLSEATFDLIVETVREIIDAVRPTRAFYTLETMPWIFPDSTDSYLRLIAAIDRPQFAVHFDPVNIISSPQLYFRNAALITDFVQRLGPYIKCCHVKDIILRDALTVHLDEVRPGLGTLDHGVLLRAMDALGVPVMLEHLPTEADYEQAAAHIRQVAQREGLSCSGA